MSFTKSKADPNLYYIFVQTDLLILVLFVDDLSLTSAKCKADMAIEFKMKDIDLMHYFLAKTRGIFLGQCKYAVQILKRFRMKDYKPMATPMIINLKKVTTSDSELVDPTLYRQLNTFS
jgi:hypothetical protein